MVCANNLAIFLRRAGAHSAAHLLSERAATYLRGSLGGSHPYTLASVINLANDVYAARRYRQALTMDEDPYARSREVLGEAHYQPLAAAANLAASRRRVGDRRGSRTLQEQTVERSRRALGERHPNTVAAKAGSRLDCDLEPQPT